MDVHALRMLMLTGAPTQLCLAHYCDVHGPTPMMVTEGLPVPCSTCFDPDAPFDDRPSTSASQPGAGPTTPPSVAAITDALRHITYSPHRSASLPASDLQSRPHRATLLRSPTSSAALPSTGSAVETPPSSPDPHKSRTAARRDSSFRRTYDEFVTKRAQPCDNCAMTLPKSDDEDASAPASDTRGPTLRTRAPYAWVFGGSGGESPPNSQPSSASDTDNDGEGEGDGDGDDEGENENENEEADDGLMKPPPPRRSGTGSTTSRSSVFSTVGGASSGSGSHTHFIEYISTKEPVLPASFSIVRASCLRTLSFETLPRTTPSSAAAAAAAAAAATSSSPFASMPGTGSAASGGPIFFGDPAAGYTTAYIFRIPDLHARGHKRVYAFLALSTHSERTAMKTFGLIAGAFRDLAGWIQALAEAEAERAGGADSPGGGGSNSSSFLTGGAGGGGGGGFGGGWGVGGPRL